MQEPSISSILNASDSMINQSLHAYNRQNFFSESHHQSAQSSSFSFDVNQIMMPFSGTLYQKYNDKLDQMKIQIREQRKKFIKQQNLGEFCKEVFYKLTKFHETSHQIQKKQNQVQKQENDLQQMKIKHEAEEILNKKFQFEDKVYKEVHDLEKELQGLFAQRPNINDWSKNTQKSEEVLMKKLNQRSLDTLNKLKPYIEYRNQQLQQDKEAFNRNITQLRKQNKNYELEQKRQQAAIKEKNRLNRVYEIQDQLEDERLYQENLREYKAKLRKDEAVIRKKDYVSLNNQAVY